VGEICFAGDGANASEIRILMADTITIPSPRVFLTAEPVAASNPDSPKPAPALIPKPKQQRKRNPTSAKAKALIEKPRETNGSNGVEKKKQSKSRNGMFRVSQSAFGHLNTHELNLNTHVLIPCLQDVLPARPNG
jgi:hypothetical protein